MLKKTGLALALSVALAGNVAALGLGEIDLDSALNQPLEAEIALLNTEGLAPEDVVVSLASPEDYQRAGVRRLFFHTGFEFQVVRRGDGLAVLVTSESPVIEPFVDFLVQVRWPQGRLLRAYTVLLDLPALSGQQSVPVPVVKSQGDQALPATAPDPRPVPTPSSSIQVAAPAAVPPPPAAANTSDGALPGSVHTVTNGETLWGIGSRLANQIGVQPQQAMVAIHRINPEAFINGDINMLRRGAVLRLPAEDAVRGIGFDDAVADIQNRLDSFAGAAPDTSPEDNLADAPAPTPEQPSLPGEVAAPAQGRLELAALDNVAADQAVATGNAGDSLLSGSSAQGLSSNIAGSDFDSIQEELDLTRLENQRMAERLAALEAQVADQQRLLELQSTELREAQLLAEPGSANSPASSSSGSWIDALRENLLWIGLVIIAGLLAIGLALRGRRREADGSGALQQETELRNYAYASSSSHSGSRSDDQPEQAGRAASSGIPASPVSAAAPGSWRATKRDLGNRESLDELLFGGASRSDASVASDSPAFGEQAADRDPEADTEDRAESAAEPDQRAVEPDNAGKLVENSGDDDLTNFRGHVSVEDDLSDTDIEAPSEELARRDSFELEDELPEPEEDETEALEFTLDDRDQSAADEAELSEPNQHAQDFTAEQAVAEVEELEVDLDSERDALGEAASVELSPDLDNELPEFTLDEPGSGFDAYAEAEDDLNTGDSVESKLELARAYMDMGDADGAIPLLKEIALEGNEQQKQAARELLVSLS